MKLSINSNRLLPACVVATSLIFAIPAVATPPEVTEMHISGGGGSAYDSQSIALHEITAQEITQQNSKNFTDVLKRSGIAFVEDSASGAYVFLRGAESNYTTILIDGVPLNDPSDSRGGSADLSRISLSEIERIEILSATEASVLGAGQLAGAINIIRKPIRAQQSSFEVSSGRSPHASGQATAIAKAESGALSFSIDGADEGSILESNQRKRIYASLRTEYDLTETLKTGLQLRAGRVRRRAFPEDSGGPDYAAQDLRSNSRSDEFLIQSSLAGQLDPQLSFYAQYSHINLDNHDVAPGVLPGTRDPFGIPATSTIGNFDRDLLTLRLDYHNSLAQHFRIGVDGYQERGQNSSMIYFGDQSIPADFLADRYGLGSVAELRQDFSDQFNLRLGSRYDQFEGFSGRFNPFILATENLTQEIVLWAGFSEASKTPSIYALSHPIVGNPQLSLERSRTFEGGLRTTLQKIRLSASLFHSKYIDAIDLDEGPPLLLVNRNAIQSRGIHLSASGALDDSLSCGTVLTFTDSKLEGSSEHLRNRPRWQSSAHCAEQLNQSTDLGLSLNYLGSLHDSSIPTGDQVLGPSFRLDLYGNLKISEAYSIGLAIDNLLNQRKEALVGTRPIGISPRIEFSGRF